MELVLDLFVRQFTINDDRHDRRVAHRDAPTAASMTEPVILCSILPISLTFDHRITDGVTAARFLARVVGFLEDPALLFIESV